MAKRGVLSHPKTLTLADTLGIMDCFALGILEAFWHHVADYYEDGDVTNLKPSVFVRSIRYQDDAGQLWAALISSGFIDKTAGGRLIVHDWPEHCNDYIHTRFFRSLKMFANGTKPKPVSIGKDEKQDLAPLWEAVERDILNLKTSLQDENNSGTVSKQLNNSLPSLAIPTHTNPSSCDQEESPTAPKTSKRFVKPTPEEIHAYMVERKWVAPDGQKFFDSYEAKGWKIKGSQMKDWRAAVRTWESSEWFKGKGSALVSKSTPVHGVDFINIELPNGDVAEFKPGFTADDESNPDAWFDRAKWGQA